MPYLQVRPIIKLLGIGLFRCEECGTVYFGPVGNSLRRVFGCGCSSHLTDHLRPEGREVESTGRG